MTSPVMVGRASELSRLADAVERVRSDGSQVVTVSGEAGIGKSRLVAALADRAQAAGFRVLAGGCLDLADGVLPLGAVTEALRPLWSDLNPATLDTVVGTAQPTLASLGLVPAESVESPVTVGPGQMLEQLRGVFTRLAALQPVLLVVEDIHWAERSTRDLLLYLSRNFTGPLLLVPTYRLGEPRQRPEFRTLLVDLHRNRRCQHLLLPPLDRSDTAEMIDAIMGRAAPAGLVDQIAARSEGNPFFVEELLATHLQGTGLPDALRTVLADRIDRLAPESRQVLGLLATLGGPVAHDMLADLVKDDRHGTLIEQLRAAVEEGVLTVHDDGRSYRFRHELLREVVYGDLIPGERSRLHEECACALADHAPPASPAERAAQLSAIAFHWHRAGAGSQALTWSARAGAAAESAGSPALATRQYQRMLDLWSQVPDAAVRCRMDRATLARRAAATAHLAGDYETASRLLTGALDTLDAADHPGRRSEFLAALGYCHLGLGDLDAAEQAYTAAYRAAADTARGGSPRPCLIRALAGQAQVLLTRGHDAAAIDAARAALALTARIADPPTLTCRALTVLGAALTNRGDLVGGMTALQRAAAASEAAHDPSTLTWVLGATADAHLLAGHPAAAIAPARRSLAVAQSLGSARNYGAWFATAAAEALFWQGDFPGARVELETLLALDPPAGARRRPLIAMASLSLAEGELDAARAACDEALTDHSPGLIPQLVADGYAVRARIAAAEGCYEHARVAVADGLAGLAGTDGPTGVIRLCAAGVAAEAARVSAGRTLGVADAEGDVDTALAWLGRARAADDGRLPVSAAELATAEAEFTSMSGTLEDQVEAWRSATVLWDALDFPYPASQSRYRWAHALLLAGATTDAERHLRAAYADAARIGAADLTSKIAELAAHARVDVAATPHRQRETSADHLTTREQQVLTLLCDGMTNRSIAQTLFISEKTVSVHVTHILAKLHVSNRGQAAAIGRRPVAPPPG